MTRPEQELLAKYLLEQLTSDNPDPILARLAREDLATEQSQTIATIVPAPPGLEKREEKLSEKYRQDRQEGGETGGSRFSMPLTNLGSKRYYLGIFFKANWAKSAQYCRYHGLHLASINSAAEQRLL